MITLCMYVCMQCVCCVCKGPVGLLATDVKLIPVLFFPPSSRLSFSLLYSSLFFFPSLYSSFVPFSVYFCVHVIHLLYFHYQPHLLTYPSLFTSLLLIIIGLLYLSLLHSPNDPFFSSIFVFPLFFPPLYFLFLSPRPSISVCAWQSVLLHCQGPGED